MANTFDGMSFVNNAQYTMQALKSKLLGLKVFSTDFSADVAAQGTVVQSRIVPASSAPVAKSTLAYTDATIIAGETTSAVTVTLNQNYVAGFEITDAQAAAVSGSAMAETMKKLIEQKIWALSNQMLTYVYGLITNANYSGIAGTVATAAFDNDAVVDIRTNCVANKLMPGMANMVLSSGYVGGLLKDAKVAAQYSSGLSAIVDGAGAIVRLGGFPVYEACTLPTTENLGGFVCTPDCMAIAMRPTAPSGQSVSTEYFDVITDTDTGASIQYYAFRDSNYRRWVHVFESNYGAAVGVAAALRRIKTAA